MQSRNIPILSIALALSQSGPGVIALLGGIVGVSLAPTPALATLPIALMVVGVAIFVIPASIIMRRIGRKKGFMIAAFVASMASLLAFYALDISSFALFCTATLLFGMNRAFVQQYRFAAVESVNKEFAGRAVSFVLVGGLFAAFLGPEIAKRTEGLLENNIYGAAFLVVSVLYILVILILAFMEDVSFAKNAKSGPTRPLLEIIKQRNFGIAAMAGAVSFAAMTLVMTATPIQLNEVCGFPLVHSAGVIQGHIIAMYLPSLFTGILLERLGIFRIMASGAIILLGAMFVGYFSGLNLTLYWIALVLLGLGWNLLFVGGTVLLTHTHNESERFKTQAANDFIVFGTQAVASFSAGSLLFIRGWQLITVIGFTVVLATFVILLTQRQKFPTGQVSA
jgi:MFS family permease